MKITMLVYSWPCEAQYSCEPDSYSGWSIEDYEFEIGNSHPQIGDLRSFESKQWTVAEIQHYSPIKDSHSSFSVALLSIDGSIPKRDCWDSSELHLMYICVSPEEIVFGISSKPELLPQVGDELSTLPGWQVNTIQEFEPEHKYIKEFDKVAVYWCSAVIQDLEQAA